MSSKGISAGEQSGRVGQPDCSRSGRVECALAFPRLENAQTTFNDLKWIQCALLGGCTQHHAYTLTQLLVGSSIDLYCLWCGWTLES